MGRHANPDIRRAFQEFQDAETPSKCNKVRCMHCGFVRAKNTTRQIEHLQECQVYLQSPEAQAHAQLVQQQEQQLQQQHDEGAGASVGASLPGGGASGSQSQVLNGLHPNPNLQVHRRGPNNKRGHGHMLAPHHPHHQHQNIAPSLTAHLLASCSSAFVLATQQPFLSHAGCGSLQPGPLSQWLVQDGHYARGYIRFVGQLLAKIRLPQTNNSQFHPMYRTMDLLISALNNMRREMQFFEITATKYGLQLGSETATPITRALLDLFVSASSSSASLLEGMVVLWGTEHCYRSAWTFASSFSATLSTPSTESHIVALHQALIPNWTSPAFSKFVDATRALVDELANTANAPNGKEEMLRCEEIFRQICWLEERFWPDVDGMGEEDESARLGPIALGAPDDNVGGMHNSMNESGMNGSGMGGPGMAPNMSNQGVNGSGMNAPMNGPMNGPHMNTGSSTPVGDGRNSFGGLEGVGQSS